MSDLIKRIRFALTRKSKRRWGVYYKEPGMQEWVPVYITYGRDYDDRGYAPLFTQHAAEYIAYRYRTTTGYPTTTERVI